MTQEEKQFALIVTTRARYDRVSYTRVLKDLDKGVRENGYSVTYTKILDKGKTKKVVEFIPDKWIVQFRKYQS